MSSTSSYFLEPRLLGVKVSCFLFFTEKSYKGFKIVKILIKGSITKNAPPWTRTCAARGTLHGRLCAFTILATQILTLNIILS